MLQDRKWNITPWWVPKPLYVFLYLCSNLEIETGFKRIYNNVTKVAIIGYYYVEGTITDIL